ncbi:unnamed protein product [Gongylonema pulchrum]|uniref:Integrase_H2C2 domain-containing protein n=1 Tax=Gongylonema pulchrum TaxID=637853 RepID=A0A183D355_9BILA|nr:unnamed protein product [Gongylonema pulchrum]
MLHTGTLTLLRTQHTWQHADCLHRCFPHQSGGETVQIGFPKLAQIGLVFKYPKRIPFNQSTVSDPTQISCSVNPAGANTFSTFYLIDEERFSSWNTLIDITAYALRFLRKIARAPATWFAPISKSGALQVKDRKITQNCLFRQAQRHISKKGVIKRDLFLDEDKLWRCGGRLTTTRLPQQEKHPIFLPRQSRITQLLLLHAHQSLLHSGVPTTLAQFCKLYWTPHRRRTTKLVMQRMCMYCRR